MGLHDSEIDFERLPPSVREEDYGKPAHGIIRLGPPEVWLGVEGAAQFIQSLTPHQDHHEARNRQIARQFIATYFG